MSGSGAGNLVALFKIDSSGAQASMTAAEISVAKAMESMKRQFVAVSARVKELEGGTRSLNNNASMAKATQEIVNYGVAAQKSQKEISRANLMLPAQISDIAVSLASGQQAWLVALQQGSQIKDMYGGVANAAQVLIGMITLKSVALTAAAGAIGVYGYALIDARQRAQAFADGIRLTGNAAGFTEASFESMAARVQAAANTTAGAARDVLQALANTGRVGPQEIEKVAVGVLRMSSVSGEAAEKLVTSFANAKDGVTKWAVEQNKQLNFMTPAIYAAAKAAEDMGNKSEALITVLDKLNPRLWTSATLWQRMKVAASDFMLPDFSGLFGNDKTADPLAAIQARIATNRGLQFRSDYDDKVLTKLLEQERLLKMARDKRESDASNAAESARVNSAGLSARQAIDSILQETKSRERLNKEIEKTQRLFKEAEAAGLPYSKSEQERVLAEIRRKYAVPPGPKPNDALHNEYAAYGRERMESDDAAREAAKKLAEQIAKDQWEIDKRNAVQMFREDSERMAKEAAEAKKQMEQLAKHGQDQVAFFEDSVMLLVRNGKDGFKDLFNTMAEEFIRNMIRMAAQKTLLDKNGAFVGWGQGASNAWGAAQNWFSGFGGGGGAPIQWDLGFAGGLDYVPYDGFPAILHKGERVQRAVEAGSARSREAGPSMVQHNDMRTIVQGDVGSRAMRAIRAGQNMQAARMANAERYS